MPIASNGNSSALMVIDNVACMGCGCVCDDLRLTVTGDEIVAAERACELGHRWLQSRNSPHKALAEIEGQPVSLDLTPVIDGGPARLTTSARSWCIIPT